MPIPAIVLIIVALLAAGGISVWRDTRLPDNQPRATSTPSSATATAPSVSPGTFPKDPVIDPDSVPTDASSVTLSLGETAREGGIAITPLSITEDSRCPADAQCVWEGKARIETKIESALGTQTYAIDEGSGIVTEAYTVTLTRVLPFPVSTREIADADYRFTYEITPRLRSY